jgi:hypothetical protein
MSVAAAEFDPGRSSRARVPTTPSLAGLTTSTDHFNILGSSGGAVGRVSAVAHASSGGTNFTITFGDCQEPQD